MNNSNVEPEVKNRARYIKLLLTDSDGVLTDSGVYYSDSGEELKRFSIRDGMGVQRLKELVGVETGIVTGENSGSVRKRAEKLNISELHLGVKDKKTLVEQIIETRNISPENVAFIGDDANDIEVLQMVGLSACPSDALANVKRVCHIICENRGGNGAFREFAEIIISSINGNH